MSHREWYDAAWSAWARNDAVTAIDLSLKHVDERPDDAIRLACYFAVRAQRADGLVDYRENVERLPRGVIRDGALIQLAFTEADLRGARALAVELGQCPDEVHLVTDEDSDDAIRAAILANVGTVAIAAGTWPNALECVRAGRFYLDRCEETASQLSHRAQASLIQTRFDLLGVEAISEFHTYAGDTAQTALLAELESLQRRNHLTPEHSLALVCLGSIHHFSGRLSDAALSLARALELATPDRPGIAEHARIELAFIRVRQGRWNDAVRLAGTSRAPRRTLSPGWFSPQNQALQALIVVLNDEPAPAEQLIEEAAEANLTVHSYLASVILLHAQVMLNVARHDWGTLSGIIDDAAAPGYRNPYRDGEWRTFTIAATWWHGDREHAYALHAARGEEDSAATDPYYWIMDALFAAHLGETEQATVSAKRALGLLGPEHDPAGRAAVRAIAADLPLDDPDLSHVESTSITPAPPLSVVPSSAAAAPVAADARTRASNPKLTAQQRRIAVAVARGYTSAEIAAMMHLTKRTIDYHVANIVQQLGLTGRREIARYLRENDHPVGSNPPAAGRQSPHRVSGS